MSDDKWIPAEWWAEECWIWRRKNRKLGTGAGYKVASATLKRQLQSDPKFKCTDWKIKYPPVYLKKGSKQLPDKEKRRHAGYMLYHSAGMYSNEYKGYEKRDEDEDAREKRLQSNYNRRRRIEDKEEDWPYSGGRGREEIVWGFGDSSSWEIAKREENYRAKYGIPLPVDLNGISRYLNKTYGDKEGFPYHWSREQREYMTKIGYIAEPECPEQDEPEPPKSPREEILEWEESETFKRLFDDLPAEGKGVWGNVDDDPEPNDAIEVYEAYALELEKNFNILCKGFWGEDWVEKRDAGEKKFDDWKEARKEAREEAEMQEVIEGLQRERERLEAKNKDLRDRIDVKEDDILALDSEYRIQQKEEKAELSKAKWKQLDNMMGLIITRIFWIWLFFMLVSLMLFSTYLILSGFLAMFTI